MKRYDAIVVGARCAGAATAMLLAREGLDVLLVDRATFPSEIPRGHFVHRHGPARLARWGLLDRLLAGDCPAVTAFTQDLGDFPLTGTGLEHDGIPFGIGPRRRVLDQLLVDAAAEAGAEVRDAFAVLEYTSDGSAITGIVGRDVRTGAVVRERATLVVGADGRGSGLAKAVEAPVTLSGPSVSCWYFSYFAETGVDRLEMHLRDERVVFAFPTNDGLAGVFVGWPAAELPAVRSDIEGSVASVVGRVEDLGERILAGKRVERFMGATHLPNFLRRPTGPGWALVGDAGCHKDPFLALGVCDALRDAELLAEAVLAGTPGEYESRRDEATIADFQMNLAGARLGPAPPEVYELRAAVRGDEAATRAYFRTTGEPLPAAA